MVMCDNTSYIVYFKQNINTHVKKLCFSRPATIDGPPHPSTISTAATMATTTTTTTSASLNQQTCPGKS